MTSNQERDRIIALSAIVQSIVLVQQIADTGQVNQAEFETLLNSLLATSAPTTEAVYGDLSQLKTGIEQIISQLAKNKSTKDIALLRHVISLLHLERKLAKQPDMLALIAKEIDQLPEHIDYFDGITSPQVVARVADVYHRTISELTPRVQVQGDPVLLQQPDNVNRVRALLLTGIRAAMLWQQKGGRRWHFVFQKNKILQAAVELNQSISGEQSS